MSYRQKLGQELNSFRRDIEVLTGLNIKDISYRTQTSLNAIILIESGNMLNVDVLAQYMVRLNKLYEQESIEQVSNLIKSKRLERI